MKKMNDIIIIEEASYNGKKGKVGILVYSGAGDPTPHLDEVVSFYTEGQGYNEFIDANMDNPWVRVIIKGINDMKKTEFDPKIHKL